MADITKQELAVWRKQANLSVQDEFTGRPLPPGLEDSLSPGLEQLLERTRSGVRRSAELYITICNVMDRLVKRSEGVAADHARIAMSLTSLTEASSDTYATDASDVPLVNDGLVAMSKHLRTGRALMDDESRAWDEGVLEDLKRQRDALVAVRDLFDRRERLDKDNIPYLERRIQTNETKLANLRSKPDGLVKPGEIDKVVESIIKVRLSFRDDIIPETLTLGNNRTRNLLSINITDPSSSRRRCVMSSSTSKAHNTMCHDGIKIGLRNESSTQRCWLITGDVFSTSSRVCQLVTRGREMIQVGSRLAVETIVLALA
jgi:sorting nexin-8